MPQAPPPRRPAWPVAVLGWVFVGLIGRRVVAGGIDSGDPLFLLDMAMLAVALWVAVTGTGRWLRQRRGDGPRV